MRGNSRPVATNGTELMILHLLPHRQLYRVKGKEGEGRREGREEERVEKRGLEGERGRGRERGRRRERGGGEGGGGGGGGSIRWNTVNTSW